MRALPNSHLNLRDASDFILTSRLGRKALAEKYEPVPNFSPQFHRGEVQTGALSVHDHSSVYSS